MVPESIRKHEDYEIRDQRWIDTVKNRLNKLTTVIYRGEAIREVEESVRLYSPSEFEDLLREGGLKVEALYGDYTGAGLDSVTPRMIAAGLKE